MRKQYETDDNLAIEKDIAQILCTAWGVTMRKLPRFYTADYIILSNDNPRAFCEIKNRTYPSSKFSSYRISLNKYIALRVLSIETGLSSLIVVRFSDGHIYYHIVDTENKIPITYGGRTDRNDWQDVEPLAVIEVQSFNHL